MNKCSNNSTADQPDYTGLTPELEGAPKLKTLARYWVYLACDGEQLGEREYTLLMQVLLLRRAHDFTLRLSNLPTRCPESSLVRSLAKLRRMGLVFTRRLYYPPRPGKLPVQYAQGWDLRSLAFNLEQAEQHWKAGQRQELAQWQAGGCAGPRPVYRFPPDFVQETSLPPPVALEIIRGAYYPNLPKWRQRAQALLETLASSSMQAGSPPAARPTAQKTLPAPPDAQELPAPILLSPAQDLRADAPTASVLRGHLFKEDDEEDEEERAAALQFIFSFFSACLNQPDYQPSPKERAALVNLLREGFTLEEITAGIEEGFARSTPPRHFTHCAAITRDLRRSTQAARQPETRTRLPGLAPEARPAAPLPAAQPRAAAPNTAQPAEPPEIIIGAHLADAVDVFIRARRQLTPDVLVRFDLMAERCEAAARAAGSSGGRWLADALITALGMARPASLINYADSLLKDWIANGRPQPPARKPRPAPDTILDVPETPPPQRKPARRSEPKAYQGIRDYLVQRGDLDDGK